MTDATAAKDISFSDLRRLRTFVREAKSKPELRQSIGDANLNRLESALTQDIFTNAETLGSPQLAGQLRRADQYYAAGQARIESALKPFADAKSGETAYNRIVQAAGSGASADGQKLLSLKRSLAPDEWGDVAANAVDALGKPTSANAATDGSGFSVNTFVTNYNKLSPRGKDILFGSVGGGGAKAAALRGELENLASVVEDLKGVEKAANSSKTMVGAQTMGTVVGLANPATTLPTAGGLSAMTLTGEMMTNPIAIRWLAKLGQAQATAPATVPGVVKQLQTAAKVNASLMPLYQQSLKLLSRAPPIGATAAAETQNPKQEP
jgi:hypothetical protein